MNAILHNEAVCVCPVYASRSKPSKPIIGLIFYLTSMILQPDGHLLAPNDPPDLSCRSIRHSQHMS